MIVSTTLNIPEIHKRMRLAAAKAGRAMEDIRLIAVSKQQPPEKIDAALNAGHREFGENRVQEAKTRWEGERRVVPELRLHFIGPLQTNKIRDAVRLFDTVHSVDSARLACALGEEMRRQGRAFPCFIQVNTGEEPQKSGVLPKDLEALFRLCREDSGLEITGLMCIPPLGPPPGPHFAFLADRAKELGLANLSMGMSADFETAIAFGATHIRVGSALFGERPRSG